MRKISKITEELVFDDILKIEKAYLQQSDQKFSRLRLNRQDAAAVLVFEIETREFVLTRQFRYAIYDKAEENILEIVAGKVDPGENHRTTAIRETEEEIGYRVKEEKLVLLNSFFASPGYTSEKYHLYYAEVSTSDKITAGGGLASENEFIDVVKIPEEKFLEMIKSGDIEDAKTYAAGLWYLTRFNF